MNKPTKEYSAMLYALADEIEKEEGCVTESHEAVREAAQRMDELTVTIRGMEIQQEGLLESLEWLLNRAAPEWESESGVVEYAEACKHARATIASVKAGKATNSDQISSKLVDGVEGGAA